MKDLEATLILALKSAKHYLTGGDLEKLCSASRKAIVSTIESLLERGYRIEEVPGEGYRLLETPHSLDGSDLKTLMRTSKLGCEILVFRRVGSTNDVAIELARSGSPEGTLVVAEEQTRGRGRLGRSWFSPPGTGLWFSIVLKPSLKAEDVVTVSLAVALGVAEVLRKSYSIPAELKWPNDVVVGARKICGILTEGDFVEGHIESVVVGVGINVLNEPDDFPPRLRDVATSIRIETGVSPSRSQVLTDILEGVEKRYLELCEKGFPSLRHDILKLSGLIGKLITVETAASKIVGLAHDIDRDGALVVRLENGTHQRIIAGEVSRLL